MNVFPVVFCVEWHDLRELKENEEAVGSISEEGRDKIREGERRRRSRQAGYPHQASVVWHQGFGVRIENAGIRIWCRVWGGQDLKDKREVWIGRASTP